MMDYPDYEDMKPNESYLARISSQTGKIVKRLSIKEKIFNEVKARIGRVGQVLKSRLEWRKSTFYFPDDSKKQRKCHLICTIDSMQVDDGARITYVIYADGTRDNKGQVRLFAGKFDDHASDGVQLTQIIDPEEHSQVQELISEIRENLGDQLDRLPF